jgi:hypothetical protein
MVARGAAFSINCPSHTDKEKTMAKPERYEVKTEIAGEYEVDDGMVTVFYSGREKSTQVGGSPPDVIARLLLGELAREGR